MFYLFIILNISAQWEKSGGNISSKTVFSIAVTGTNVYAGTGNSGVFVSTDEGENFADANSMLINNGINSVMLSGSNIFVGTYNGVFISTDNGANWSDANSNGLDTIRVWALIISGNNIFAGTDEGIYLTTDSGDNWSIINNGLTVKTTLSLAVKGTDVFAGTYGGGIFISSDNGASWDENNTGSLGSAIIYCLAVSGSNIFAGTRFGEIYISSDNGDNWSEATTDFSLTTQIHALSVSGSNIFAGTSDGVFLSTNNGTDWKEINEGLTSTSLFIFSLAVSDSYLFAGIEGDGVWRRALSEITDVESNSDGLVSDFNLEQNFPNPFNPTTSIKYSIPSNNFVTLKVYDLLGREVAILVNEEKHPGIYEIKFNASSLSSGAYFYKLQAGDFIDAKKFVLMK